MPKLNQFAGLKLNLASYQCFKRVAAQPMTRGEFHHLQRLAGLTHGAITDDEAKEPGYLVVYSKGTPEEYVSWSPKKAFNDGYAKA